MASTWSLREEKAVPDSDRLFLSGCAPSEISAVITKFRSSSSSGVAGRRRLAVGNWTGGCGTSCRQRDFARRLIRRSSVEIQSDPLDRLLGLDRLLIRAAHEQR